MEELRKIAIAKPIHNLAAQCSVVAKRDCPQLPFSVSTQPLPSIVSSRSPHLELPSSAFCKHFCLGQGNSVAHALVEEGIRRLEDYF
ncbi:hypothetical protein Gotri_003906 [Gossypium trilobum]|uniref:Uncharacterized protein n=1 Tax=Gossypium trilobum TaxID=34281 RepID=A0A7J9F3C9_9ROSI|nr:hypothetical protein [Gossypium trilobum]